MLFVCIKFSKFLLFPIHIRTNIYENINFVFMILIIHIRIMQVMIGKYINNCNKEYK